MNKTDLAGRVAAGGDLSHAQASAAIDTVIESISKSLRGGDRVMLIGLGTFSVAKRTSRKGRNPQTGRTITIPAARVVKFKAGAELKKLVNRPR
jgi:DNA-binding protein HU-beta